MKAGEKPDEGGAKDGPPNDKDAPGKKSGWIDLGRLRISVKPVAEWRQMLREAWRLQCDNFWTEDMSKVDWEGVYRNYAPLVERVATRGEFSDLVWEMQGELGTSHAYPRRRVKWTDRRSFSSSSSTTAGPGFTRTQNPGRPYAASAVPPA